MRNTAWIRYTVAVVALLVGFGFSIRLSERGVLFDSHAPGALASAPEDGEVYDLQALTILNRVLLQMKDNYVEPDRIDPLAMLAHSLDRVQNSVPEIVALFDADLDGGPTQVEVRVGTETQVFELTNIESLWEMSFKLREIFRFLQDHVDTNEIDLQEVEYAAINGMLSTLDPHSVLLTPEINAEMQTNNRGSFGGLGIVISIRDGQLTVISPIADTPAGRAGFRAGDRIVKIDDESTVNMPLDEAVSRLRGPVDSEVTVEVMRDGWSEPHSFTLAREVINIESVTSQALGDGIGYIRIQNFQGNTHDDMMTALDALETEMGSLRGLVLDMRNNPGGLLQQAIRISDTFLDEGTIVTTVGVGDRLREENPANSSNTQPNYPIVVLVNPGSASASEIVAGALKNHNRAIVVGDTTFGKGSVQMLYEFQDGSALKLTIAQYLTPGDVSIQGVGIVPDIQLFPATVNDEIINLYPAESIAREGDLDGALTSDRVASTTDRPSAVVRYDYEPEEIDPEAIVDPDAFEMDFEIEFARALLVGAGETWERSEMLGVAQDVIDETQSEQMVTIQERLRNRNVDWSLGENVIQPVTLAVTTDRPDNRFEAGESIALTVTATNDGDRPLHRVRAVSTSAYDLFHDHEFPFGRLEPGESRSWTVDVEVPIEDPTRYEDIEVQAWADTIALGAETVGHVLIDGRERPHWGLSYRLDDAEGGNGDGLAQVGEDITMRVTVVNTGRGDTDESIVILRNQSERAVFLHTGREEFEALGPGERLEVNFDFTVREAPEDGVLALDLEVYDTVFREFLREELQLPISTATGDPQVRSGAVEITSEAEIRAGASDTTPAIAHADAGAVLTADRYVEGWYHVSWDDGEGWIDEATVAFREGAAASGGSIRERLVYQPPVVELTSDTWVTDAETFTLEGVVTDDQEVLDYYLFVASELDDMTIRSTKRDYQHLGVPSATITSEVALNRGMNRITVIARDEDRASSSQVLYVYRQ